MSKPKKILIIRLGALGDVVMTTIIAKAVKQKHPDYIIHYLTQSEIAPVIANCPDIDKIILWDRKNRKSFKQLVSVGFTLFKEHYDIVFNLTVAVRNCLLSLMSCAGRIVYRKRTKGLWIEDFYYTAQSVIKDIDKPDRLDIGLNPKSEQTIDADISNYPHPYIMIAPGGGTDRTRQGRIWNIKNWKELITKLQNIYGGTVFVCGIGSELDYHKTLSGQNVVICSGRYNINESSALLSKADLMISGDTGPLHIASAHNVKTLALLGSTSPDKIKPYGKNGYYISSDDECKYCWKKKCIKELIDKKYTPCMEHITTDMVLNKIKAENLL